MSDIIDRANDYAALILEQKIIAARREVTNIFACICEHCDGPIQEGRRKAMMGCWLCADCQTLSELKSRYYRSI